LVNQKREEAVELISKLVSLLTEEEKQAVLSRTASDSIPVSVFRSSLSGLEALTVFLKDNRNKSISDIAQLINRKPSTLYTTYNNAKTKLKQELDTSDISITLPVSIFSDRKFSILESIVAYLKDNKGITLSRIAALLGKNQSTIKTTYRRYQEKRT
jgi:DNA-directed RNA polymerase specialized sigma24 family protein